MGRAWGTPWIGEIPLQTAVVSVDRAPRRFRFVSHANFRSAKFRLASELAVGTLCRVVLVISQQ